MYYFNDTNIQFKLFVLLKNMIEICIINKKNYKDEYIYYQWRAGIRTLRWFF